MTPALRLIGDVGQRLLARALERAAVRPGDDVARFLLDLLEPEQVAAIVRAVIQDSGLAAKFCIRVPADFARDQELPANLLTRESAVWFRNNPPQSGEVALLLASTGDDKRESLGELTRFGARDLTAAVSVWVAIAASDLPIDATQRGLWERALEGLNLAREVSLTQFAEYVSVVRDCIRGEGLPLIDAIGFALPALRLPRDSSAFLTIKDKQRSKARAWRQRFDQLFWERHPLLTKHLRTGQGIDPEDLRRQYQQIRDELKDEHRPLFESFIDAPASWCSEANRLAELQWDADSVGQLFTGLKTRQTRNLGKLTREHFEDHDPGLLTDEVKAYLDVLSSRRSYKDPDDQDKEFYEQHVGFLALDAKLKAKWDTFIFGAAVECTELLDGLLTAIERLRSRVSHWTFPKTLDIRVHGRGNKYFRELNADVATLFSLRYRGLKALFSDRVTFDLGRLNDFEAFLEEDKGRGHTRRNQSTSRSANAIKIDVALSSEDGAISEAIQVVWSGRPDAISSYLPLDLDRLLQRPLSPLEVHRNRVSKKGDARRLSLADSESFEPVYGRMAGSLVPRVDELEDLEPRWIERVKETTQRGTLSHEQAAQVQAAWKIFAKAYQQALKEFRAGNIGDSILEDQAQAYGQLLNQLGPLLIRDRARADLITPILQLGVVSVADETSAAVIAPWHPLRLAAIAVKARRVTRFINHVLAEQQVDFGDAALFFRDFREQLRHPHYPEVAVGYSGSSARLLVVTDTLDEYSLAEEPIARQQGWRSQADPTDSAARVGDTVERYLNLEPHANANLSVALYNCDSAGLPIATVDALASLQENDIHCHVVLRHSDRPTLARIYSELLEHADSDPDALVASETSRTFMANLRVGIQLETPRSISPRDPREVDIAFLDDVVARRAQLSFVQVENASSPPSLEQLIPGQWSYRLPVGAEQTSAVRYLVCPEQPSCGREYLRAVAAVIEPESGQAASYRLPVRRLGFNDDATARLLKEVHSLAEWVVNYDDLLEPMQLRNQGVQVIRYRRDATQGRNLIISSTAESGILLTLVQRRLEELALGLSREELRGLAKRLVDDAISISGEIVLRATKRGVFAGELIGVVLSRSLIREELGSLKSQAWFFLDDYAAWLGQREDVIADLLVLCPVDRDGQLSLQIRVAEAKYVTDSVVTDARKKSKSQLQATITRINQALFGTPGRLDRDLWLARLSELLLEGTHSSPMMAQFERLHRSLRNGTAPIELRGYSHVFVSGPADATTRADQESLPDTCGKHSTQEVFNQEAVRALLLRYARGETLIPVREMLGTERPWLHQVFEQPAARPAWLTRIDAAVVPAFPSESREAERSAETPHSKTVIRHTKSDAVSTTPTPSPVATGAVKSSFELLATAKASKHASDTSSAWLEETTNHLRQALANYQLQAKVVSKRLTPNAALICLQGSDRLQVKDIETRRSQLLTTYGLNVISVRARPREVVVAIARPEREVVSLWDVWVRIPSRRKPDVVNLSLLVGLNELDGEPLYLNLGEPHGGLQSHAPHTLVAGTTGSGKSVLIQNLLLDLAVTNDPAFAKVYLIDPKMGVDYFPLEGLPHLAEPIITEQARAIAVLESLVGEMNRRYELFRLAKVNKLSAYNAVMAVAQRLPALFVVHDEFAEWMLTDTYRDLVASVVSRLSVKARAAGIYLLFAAQRPDKDVLPMQLRTNLGNRLILRVEDEGTSDIALGEKGAERLLGRGHVAARLQNEPEVLIGQVPWLSSQDAALIVDAQTLAT